MILHMSLVWGASDSVECGGESWVETGRRTVHKNRFGGLQAACLLPLLRGESSRQGQQDARPWIFGTSLTS